MFWSAIGDIAMEMSAGLWFHHAVGMANRKVWAVARDGFEVSNCTNHDLPIN